MSELKIITNNQARDIIYWFQLTDKEKLEYDYLDTESKQEYASFFRYKNNVYDLEKFMRIENHDLKGWYGYLSDSFFSGILVKYPQDEFGNFEDGIIVGWYLS